MRVAGNSDFYPVSVIDPSGRAVGRPSKLPSVTTILKAMPTDFNIPAWYGYKMGVEAVLDYAHNVTGTIVSSDLESAYTDLKKAKRITPNVRRNSAADRGTNVHEIAEYLFQHKQLPDVVPTEQRGYVQGLWDWYQKHDIGSCKIIASEEPLHSLRHQYAGTVDMIAKVSQSDTYMVFDLKTRAKGGAHDKDLLQVTAYGAAAVEMKLIPKADIHNVLCVHPDGTYQVDTSWRTLDEFLAIKKVWEILQAKETKR